MKKILTAFLALALIFSCVMAVACDEPAPSAPKTYTITFMVDGNVYKTQEVEEGKYVVKPVAPDGGETKEFAYWCSDAELQNEFIFSQTKPTADMTLYAKFTAKETPIAVRFYKGETEIDNGNVTTSSPLTLGNAEPDKGYMFWGWSAYSQATNPDFREGYLLTKMVADNLAENNELKLYAIFRKADLNIAVWERYYLETTTLEDTKAAFEDYMEGKELYYIVEYRIYDNEHYNKVADFGAAIVEDGDIDVIIGSGANISSAGGVTVITKAALLAAYDPASAGRQAALVTDGAAAVEFYKFVTGLSDNKATVTLNDGVNNDPFVLSELLGDKITYTVPAKDGFTFVGYAYTDGATAADISTNEVITYATVKDHLTDNAVTLYPVYEQVTYDLTVYVHLSASKTTYITEDEFNALKAAGNAANPTANINWVAVTKVNGDGFCEAAVNGGADVMIGGNNMTTEFDEDFPKTNITTSWFENTSRYIGVVEGSEMNEVAMKLFLFVVNNNPQD